MAVRVFDRMVQFLLGCSLIITAVVLVRMHHLSMTQAGPAVAADAARTYQQRIQATETLLRYNTLEVSTR